MMKTLLQIASLCLLMIAGVARAAAGDDSAADPAPARGPIIAFGDVHGGYQELRALLEALDIIDDQGAWIAGNTRLVSLGDLLDRGPDSRPVMDLLMRLESEAAAAGGAFYLVLGNHEIMNLVGDLRYVSQEEYAAFADEEDPAMREAARQVDAAAREAAAEAGQTRSAIAPDEALPAASFEERYPPGFFGHRAAFRANGFYGRWLLSKPQILVLEGKAFVHGGLSSHFVAETVAGFNASAKEELLALLTLGDELSTTGKLAPWPNLLGATPVDGSLAPPELSDLQGSVQFSEIGPSWYRGTAGCHQLLEEPQFEAVLEARGIGQVIMGHTPTNPRVIQTRFDGRAILADTGMYGAYYRGRPSAVIFAPEGTRFLTLTEEGVLEPRGGHPAVDVRAGGSPALMSALHTALEKNPAVLQTPESGVMLQGRRYAAIPERGSRAGGRALAAQALDGFLGFGLVAPTLPTGDGDDALQVFPANSLTEQERQEQGIYRPNYCVNGSDYELLYVLDALLGIDSRAADDIHYDRATWLMYLTGHNRAFPNWTRLPRYLSERPVQLSPRVAERLASLTPDAVEDTLGQWLNRRQQEALLARAELIREQWGAETAR